MDRFEEMQYQIAMESVGGVIAGGVAAITALAITKAVVKGKIDKHRMRKYDKERAAGNVSDKTRTKADTVMVHGMKYPEYAELEDHAKNLVPVITKIIDESKAEMKAQIEKFCASKPEFNAFKDSYRFWDFSSDDIIRSLTLKQRWDIEVVLLMDTDSIDAIMEDIDDDDLKDDYAHALNGIAADGDINMIKRAGMQVVRAAVSHLSAIVKKSLNTCARKINAIDGINCTAVAYDDYDPDSIYRTYGIIFKN